ncbi:MAG: hypothetical protein IJ722_01855 [Alloprevotella sp.]|nr:hypothetical protein [Alloprevotella sp.]
MEFNLTRFGLVLKRDLLTNRRVYINFFLGMFVFYVTLGCLSQMNFNNALSYTGGSYHMMVITDRAEYTASFLVRTAGMANAMFFLFLLFSVAQFAYDLREKPSRINALMLPASRLEKFLGRWLLLVPGACLVAVAAFACADAARLAVQPVLFEHTLPSLVPEFFRQWNFFLPEFYVQQDGHVLVLLSALGSRLLLLFVHASYLLGGLYFRKRGALMTTVLYLVGNFVFVLLAWRIADLTDSAEFWQNLRPGLAYYAVLDALLFALTAGCVWLSWRKFSRMQVL